MGRNRDQEPSGSDAVDDLLVTEWIALRQEILARIEFQHRVVLTATITIGGVAIAMKTILDRGWYAALVLIGMLFFALAAQYVEQDRLIARIGMYVNWEIRPALEGSFGSDSGILGWESFRGQPLSKSERIIATILSAIRYLPSLGAGLISVALALLVSQGRWPAALWEWILWLAGAAVGGVLAYAAYLTHRDYNLVWSQKSE